MTNPTQPTPDGRSWTALFHTAVVQERSGVPVIGSLVAGEARTATKELAPRISPATGRTLFEGGDSSDDPVKDAVGAARGAFDTGAWGRSTGRDRSRLLRRVAGLIESRCEDFAELIVLETGKPLREARGEVAATINAFDFYAGLARDIGGRTNRDINANLLAFTLREPAGVAGIIVPWNFPLAILGQKLPAALAAGCTAVIKPSPLTPLSSLAVAQTLYEAGLEPEAVSVLVGGGTCGATLVSHPRTDVISFTGSTQTARHIASTAGTHRLKRVALEAGGKTPVLVTSGADLDLAVDGLLFSSFFNQGQVCVAGSRILADRAVVDELSERLADRASAIRLGDPFTEHTEMGPLISQQHFDGVQDAVQTATTEGATVLTGGTPSQVEGSNATPYMTPTVLRSESDTNVAVREELFGPVTVVQSFLDLDEAVRRANEQPFGLAASVWTQDIDEALELTLSLRTGTVWVNGSTDAFPEIPLGGRRDSGYGAEFGREGMEFFTEMKSVQINRASSRAWYQR